MWNWEGRGLLWGSGANGQSPVVTHAVMFWMCGSRVTVPAMLQILNNSMLALVSVPIRTASTGVPACAKVHRDTNTHLNSESQLA